jgi:hypothetical protein
MIVLGSWGLIEVVRLARAVASRPDRRGSPQSGT